MCGFCLLWPIYAQGPLDEIRPCAKTNFPVRTSFVTPRLAAGKPRGSGRGGPAPLPILSVNCKILKYNLLRKRGVSVFNTPLLHNQLKISILHFTPSDDGKGKQEEAERGAAESPYKELPRQLNISKRQDNSRFTDYRNVSKKNIINHSNVRVVLDYRFVNQCRYTF